MFKSCFWILVLIGLGVFAFYMYQRYLGPQEESYIGIQDAGYDRSILNAVDPLVADNPNIQNITLDGSLIDIHYIRDQSVVQYRRDATQIAEAFSRRKMNLTSDGDVTVRCVHDDLIRLEATASNGRLVNLREN